MKLKLITLAGLSLLAAGTAQAQDGKALLQKSGCTACHSEDKKLVGPAYKDVAAKYKGDAGAVDKLAAKIKAGGKGVWGEIPMPPNNVTPDEAKKLVTWILSQK